MNIEQLNQVIANVENKIESLNSEINAFQSKIESKQHEIDSFEYEVSESDFDDFIDDVEEAVTIYGIKFYPSDILKSCDPIAYRCAKADYESDYDLDAVAEYQDLKQELEELQDKLVDLESELEELESELEDFQDQLDSLESE